VKLDQLRTVCLSLTALLVMLLALPGCRLIARIGTDETGEQYGKIFYLGGAGVFGHVGTTSVPNGLRSGGWRGAVEVIGWQSTLGGTIRDQMDAARNRKEAQRLRRKIMHYQDRFPGQPVHIIALSAGTGVAVWAVADLPEPYRIHHMVLLSSSLSARYDLGPVLDRMEGELWNIYSPTDEVLRLAAPLSGSVDRKFTLSQFAGLSGFKLPLDASAKVRADYASRVLNMPWEREFSNYGYNGRHAEVVNKTFIEHVVTPLTLRRPLPELLFDGEFIPEEPAEPLLRFEPNSPELEPVDPNATPKLKPVDRSSPNDYQS
jgi:pimeloyl-ACP methyl ester carboxylesterase